MFRFFYCKKVIESNIMGDFVSEDERSDNLNK